MKGHPSCHLLQTFKIYYTSFPAIWMEPVRIRVRIDSPHPFVCRKRRLNRADLRMRPEKPRPRVTGGVARCKTNTRPILMHQMRISTTSVSSVVLRPKKLEIRKRNREKCIRGEKKTKQILCHENEPNPSKDRAMHEGDNPSFWDEFMNWLFSWQ
jgi:hypothetical protein